MTMPLWQGIATVAAVVLGTLVTRFLPFLLFPAGKPTPKFIQYLGRVLPFAVIGLLVIYCLKGVSVTAFPFGLPELIAIILVAVLHYWKSNMLLSIGCSSRLPHRLRPGSIYSSVDGFDFNSAVPSEKAFK